MFCVLIHYPQCPRLLQYLEDIKWLNIPLHLRPAFAALALNEYGWSTSAAENAIRDLGLGSFDWCTPSYFVHRASTASIVAGNHDWDDDDTIGRDHPQVWNAGLGLGPGLGFRVGLGLG